ncbi:hypothetical protein LTR62_001434 [Meristemomyces frigidus]|uniref:Cytochrome P450 n=1 Tax=Meristemomyces frigidus TaxID=1508187 RepID=A0AAN7TG42_9PEZI|nr:hypothetical protein LTR62_001434 [Meristemomyces frigidus]
MAYSLGAYSITVALAGLVLLVTLLYGVVQRVCLSPLARFPGPKLAALTRAYQFYFDVLLQGQMPWELARLHAKYGPIVRIGPNELHVADADFYDILYASPPHRRDKDIFAIDGFGLADSVIATAGHDHHKLRRAALNPFFSTQAVARLEQSVVRPKIELFCRAFVEAYESGAVVDMESMTLALTQDVITEYAYSRSYDFLSQPERTQEWKGVLRGAAQSSMLFRYLPFLIRWLLDAPLWLISMLDPKLLGLFKVKSDLEIQVKDVLSTREHEGRTKQGHRTIFHDLLENDNLPASEKTLPRLVQEAQIIIAAGTTTTVHYLKSTVYFIIANKTIAERLRRELEEAIPDPKQLPPLHVLERLPYMSAVVKEGFRVNDGASTRLARISPDSDLEFAGKVIPRGTAVSMSTWIQHRNPVIFPEPEVFDPERWLGPHARELERDLVNFSTRNCLGINLAKSEIYLTLAAVFRRFELELFETERKRDVDMANDYFVPYARADSEGIRVLVKGMV